MFSRFSLVFVALFLVSCSGSESNVDIVLDIDGDGVIDSLDAYPQNSAEAYDTDNDLIGNNADTDDDNDGIPDITDAFPLDDSETLDTDGDGIGDNADPDLDNDGILDEVDTDSDNDGTDDTADDFPLDATEATDTDNDGIGNNADLDDDGDGTLDVDDVLPLTPNALPTLSVTTPQLLNEKSNYLITATGNDADGPVTYSWAQVSGVTLDIQQQNSATVSITTPAVTQNEPVVFTVTVTDTDGLMITENISATITANTPPTISINLPTLTGIVGETFSFDATPTSDVDNDTLGFLWNLDAFPGVSSNLLSSTNTISTILSTDIYGSYQLSLNVTDGIEISTQQITVDVAPARFGTARFGNHAWSLTQ